MFPSNIHRTIDLTTFTEMENKQPALLHGSINIGFERFMETSGQQRYIWSLVYVLLKILQYFSEIAPSSEVKLQAMEFWFLTEALLYCHIFSNGTAELTHAFIAVHVHCIYAVGSRLFQGDVLDGYKTVYANRSVCTTAVELHASWIAVTNGQT